MAGEGGGGGVVIVPTGGGEGGGGTTVGGFLSDLFLGVDLHRKAQQRKRRSAQQKLYQAQVYAESQELARRAAAGPARPLIQPRQPPPTGQQQPPPQTVEQRIAQDLELALALAQQIQDWIAQRRAARAARGAGFDWLGWLDAFLGSSGGAPAAGGDQVAYVVSSGYPQGYGISNVQTAGMGGGIWGGIGQALGQLASGAISAIAMPGGAPVGGGWPQLPGLGGGFAPTPTLPRVGGRAPSIIVANGRAYRSLGTPLAWSGDLTAVKRLRRAAKRIGHVIPRRGGARFR